MSGAEPFETILQGVHQLIEILEELVPPESGVYKM